MTETTIVNFFDTSFLQKMDTKYVEVINDFESLFQTLFESFDGWGNINDVENYEYADKELHEFLSQLDICYPNADPLRIRLAISERIRTLTCFKFRVFSQPVTGAREYWNPLNQSFKSFTSKHKNKEIVYRLTDETFPSVDILTDWINHQIAK